MKEIPVKRFIAGAVCPSCSEMDKIVMYKDDGNDVRECVGCGFTDKMQFKQKTRELETRVNITEEEKKSETQVLQFPSERTSKPTTETQQETEIPSNVTPIEPVRTEHPIEDDKVLLFLNDRLSQYPGDTTTQKIGSFYRDIYTYRRTQEPENFNYVAVERYLLNRFMAGVTGDVMTHTIHKLDNIYRRVFVMLGIQPIDADVIVKELSISTASVSTDTEPQEESSQSRDSSEDKPAESDVPARLVLIEPARAHLLKWEHNGSRDGIEDWKKANPGKEGQPGSTISVLMNPATRY